ncbi:MAG: hypothetical protein EBY17_08185 [Acidobacteriia bacterium]|nr:hypothetical protein [Terriglobia bacterium]
MQLLLRVALFFHRWMGTAFCALFAWWFVSGIFMMYWDFPAVTEADRLQHARPLNPSRVLRGMPGPGVPSLVIFDGRPAWISGTGARRSITFADDGKRLLVFSPEVNLRTAAEWAGRPAGEAQVEMLTEADQWTVQGSFGALRPLAKYEWPDGQAVYISTRSGEVVQYTTRRSRLFAWLGAIPHWLYFTPLRTNTELWSRVVIWASGLATLAALLGLGVGLAMLSPRKKYRHSGLPTAIPYSGVKRLHTQWGLCFGVLVCTWAFSGMLSMDPIGSPARGRSSVPAALRSVPDLRHFTVQSMADALRKAPGTVLLTLAVFAGETLYVARVRVVREYDFWYCDRLGRKPLPAVLVTRAAEGMRYYVDPRTAAIVGSYRTNDWVNRWLYHGLHSLDFPLLYRYRPLWDVVMLVLLGGGLVASGTGVVLGFRVLRQRVFRA